MAWAECSPCGDGCGGKGREGAAVRVSEARGSRQAQAGREEAVGTHLERVKQRPDAGVRVGLGRWLALDADDGVEVRRLLAVGQVAPAGGRKQRGAGGQGESVFGALDARRASACADAPLLADPQLVALAGSGLDGGGVDDGEDGGEAGEEDRGRDEHRGRGEGEEAEEARVLKGREGARGERQMAKGSSRVGCGRGGAR